MVEDWKQQIAVAWCVKQDMMQFDRKRIYSYYLPELAASEEQIRAAELHLGFTIDPRYREFLKYANGWKCFSQTTDLFGAEDLYQGPRHECGQFLLSMLSDQVLAKSGIMREAVLPIAASPKDRDLCVILRPESVHSGMVLWFGGGEIARFASFDDYFVAMVDYDRLEAREFKAGGGSSTKGYE